MLNRLFSEDWAILGVVDPDAYTASPATTVLTDAIDMSKYHQVAFIIAAGNFAAAASTLNFSVTQAATSGGTYKAVSGLSITAMTGSPSDDDKQAIVVVNPTDLDMANNYRWLKGSLVIAAGTSTVDATVIALGLAKSKPASDSDLASVAEIVNL